VTASPPLVRERAARGKHDDGGYQPLCAMCGHDLADHDPIDLRYCHATQAQALTRRCICQHQ
jgi:hypothetical protein